MASAGLDVSTQPKQPALTMNYDFSDINLAWLPKSLQGLPARPDASKAFMDSPLLNMPLPIYSTEASAEAQARLKADTLPVEATEPSPLATYGVLPVSFFGLSALAANEMFILNEESLLIGTWSCFLLTTYLQGSDAFAQNIATTANTLKETHVAGVDAQLAAIDALTGALNARVQSVAEAKKMQEAFTAMLHRVKAMAVHKQKRMLHQLVNDRLREVYQIETEGSKRAVEYVVKTVNDIVVALFSTSPGLRKAVLAESVTALSAGSGAKLKNDLLLQVYKVAFQYMRYEMEKLRLKGFKLDAKAREALATDVANQMRRSWGKSVKANVGDAIRNNTTGFKLPSYTRDSA